MAMGKGGEAVVHEEGDGKDRDGEGDEDGM